MSALKDLTGKRFGKLIVLRRSGNDKHKNATWLCQCDCGNRCNVVGANLWRGDTKSCGCYKKTNKYEEDGAVTRIHLTNGSVVLVDTEDVPKISMYQWSIARGYAVATINNKTTSMHRLIMDAKDGFVVDHINHNELDNRKSNLRVCTQSNNAMNRKKASNNTSGYIGVVFKKDCGKWEAFIRVDKKRKYLGLFETPELAHEARKEAEEKYFGEFAYQG